MFNQKINVIEWASGSAACFLVAGIVHLVSFGSQTSDFEVWSGRITMAIKESAWKESYDEPVYADVPYKDSQGKRQTRRERVGWRPTTRWHSERFYCSSNIGTTYSISEWQFETWARQWQSRQAVPGDRSTSEHNSRFISGDPNDYEATCPHNIVEPVHKKESVVNRIIASKSVFSFIELTPEQRKRVFDYPEVSDPFMSRRVLGTAANTISVKEWDCMNARLGPVKRVNLVIVGFDSSDHYLGELLRSNWKGGKKNDLVLCYGDKWAKVFGWSDSDILKKELEAILLEGNVSNLTLPRIESAVMAGYEKTNWHKFDHLSVEPNESAWFWFWLFMAVSQFGLWLWFHFNDHEKEWLAGFATDASKSSKQRASAFLSGD